MLEVAGPSVLFHHVIFFPVGFHHSITRDRHTGKADLQERLHFCNFSNHLPGNNKSVLRGTVGKLTTAVAYMEAPPKKKKKKKNGEEEKSWFSCAFDCQNS